MTSRLLAFIGAFATIALLGAVPAGQGDAKTTTAPAAGTWTPARTPWGDPDLNGIWGAGYFFTPLERPAKYAGREFLTDAEVAALEKETAATFGIGGGAGGNSGRGRPERGTVADVEGAYNDIFSGRGRYAIRTKRTSLIVDPPDGKIPPLTPEGEKRAAALRRINTSESGPGGPADDPEQRPPNDRCLGITLPIAFGVAASAGAHSRIVQSAGAVTVYYEHGHHGGVFRTIPLNGGPHLSPSIRQWLGDPRGRWEDGALVVDTTNFSDRTNYHGSRENLHLIERFERVQADMILYRATVDDPTTFTRAWTIEVPLTKLDDQKNQIFESACHEGNYALTSVLAGARLTEKTAGKKRGVK